MLQPSIDELLKITKSKFILTEIIAKRAIEIMNINDEEEEINLDINVNKKRSFNDKKEIEIALEELYNNDIKFSLSNKK